MTKYEHYKHIHTNHSFSHSADDLLGRMNDPLERFPLCYCTPGVPHTDAICQGALYRAPMKGHQQFPGDVILPSHPQEVQSPLGLFQQLSVVRAPGQVLLSVDSEEVEVNCSLR